MEECPDFEWVTAQVTEDEETVERHHLVDPSGQVRAIVDCPVSGRITHWVELLESEGQRTAWVSLGLAKARAEMEFSEFISRPRRVKKKKV